MSHPYIMKNKVYYIAIKNQDSQDTIRNKFDCLIKKSGTLNFIQPNNIVAIKMHFGEEGNTGFVRPEFARLVCDEIKAKNANCFVSDTNTLYSGRRTNSGDHLALAGEHGFSKDTLGAAVIIPDDTDKQNIATLNINQKFVKQAKVAKLFIDAEALVGIAHFKGHIMTGFGGALKNIGMGCATREGKLVQHGDVSPVVYADRCTGCGACEKVCPVDAITITNKKACIDAKKCIGCASCIAACPVAAIDVDWGAGEDTIQEKMVEYTKAVLDTKREKKAFFNFLIKITKECDCLAKDDPAIAPDIGILASPDPVAIDKASLDLVLKAAGKDVFKQAHPDRNGLKHLEYAAKLGLGSLEYELIEAS